MPGSGRADDAPIRIMSGGAAPKALHQTIRMELVDVTIRLHKNSYTVDAVFHFFNTGETTTEWVGFPKRGVGNDPFFRTGDFIRFETWVDGQKVQFSEERDLLRGVRMLLRGISSDNRWLVKQVTFPGHAATTTRVRYEAEYQVLAEADVAYYIYGTGSYWMGAIGKATFTIDGTEIGGPGRFEVRWPEKSQPLISGNEVTYEVRNLKPVPDAWLEVGIKRR